MSEPNRIKEVDNQGEPIQHLRLGDLELWILPDTFFMQEAGLFALEAREHEIAELLRNDLLRVNQLRVAACPILLKKDGNLILIDAGIGSQIPGNPGKLPQQLALLGISAEEISTVLVTHLHAAHIGGAFGPETPLFPNAVFYIPEPEVSFWKNPDLSQVRKVPPELLELTIRTNTSSIAEQVGRQEYSFSMLSFCTG
jgi:glyoxylase-like metal-dependent hydrolase (beta-lactamase superfamily II)